MTQRLLSVLAFVGLVVPSLLADPVSAQPATPPREAPLYASSHAATVPDQYIVVFREDAPAASEDQAIARGKARGLSVHFRYGSALRGFAATMTAGELDDLRRDPSVEFVQADSIVTVATTQDSPPSWGLDRVDQRALPVDNSYTYNATGANVNAYVIDTGILATHAEFGGRVSGGINFISDSNGTSDCAGHGTHVAGTIGGVTVGIAKGVHLHPVRVLDCNGSGSDSGVIAGVNWVTANRVLPAVANMSLTTDGPDPALESAVEHSIASGVTYAVAAGNAPQAGIASDACGISPARTSAAITVGASNSSDQRAFFSDFGPCVDLFAPGQFITSACLNGLSNCVMSGTSMATPHVTGAAALYLESNPSATPAMVRSQLVGTATTGTLTAVGAGSPNRLLYTLGVLGPPSAGGTVADGWGGLHPFSVSGGAAPVAVNAPYWPGWNIVRGVATTADGTGGYELDGWGGLHPFHFSGGGDPPAINDGPYWPGQDVTRGLAISGGGGYVLDAWGGLHPFGAMDSSRGAPYWPGQDVVRGVALMPDGGGGYVLDAWGALHAFAVGSNSIAPSVNNASYWPGWDIARGVSVLPDGSGGYVLDAWGGLHPFGIGGRPPPPLPTGGPYWPGQDVSRGEAIRG